MTAPVELLIVERNGERFGVPAARISEIGALPAAARVVRLQQRLGQPPLADEERCFGLAVDAPGGRAVVAVAGQVTIEAVADIAPLPEIMVGVAPVTGVVFVEGAPVLVLDVDAMIEHARVAP